MNVTDICEVIMNEKDLMMKLITRMDQLSAR